MSSTKDPGRPDECHKNSTLDHGPQAAVLLDSQDGGTRSAFLPESSVPIDQDRLHAPFSGTSQVNLSVPGINRLTRLLATGVAGQVVSVQPSPSVAATQLAPHHPHLTMRTEQAFMIMFSVTQAPDVNPAQDPTIDQVEGMREGYIVRMMDAMHNLTDIHDNLNTYGRYQYTVLMFDRTEPATHNHYVGKGAVESCCHILFEVIIDRCREGFRGKPKEDLARRKKSGHGRMKDVAKATPDMEANCYTRIEKIIEILHVWKTACSEVFKDLNHMFALANHPHAIWKQKPQYAISNRFKAEMTKILKGKVKGFKKEKQVQDSSHSPSYQPSYNTVYEVPSDSGPNPQPAAPATSFPGPQTASDPMLTGSPTTLEVPLSNPPTGPDGYPVKIQAGRNGPNPSDYGLPSHHEHHAYFGKPTQGQHSPMHLTGATIGTFNAFAAPLNSNAGFDSMFRSGQYNRHTMNAPSITGTYTQRGTMSAQSWDPSQTGYPHQSQGLSPASPSAVQGLHAAPRAQTSRQFQQRHNAGFQNQMGAQDTNRSQQLHETHLHTFQPSRSFGPGHSAPPQARAASKRPPSQSPSTPTKRLAQNSKKPRTGEVNAAAQLQQPGTPGSQVSPHVRDKVWQVPMSWPASIGAKLPASLIAAHNAAEAEAETGTDSDDDSDEEDDLMDYPECYKHLDSDDDDDHAADEDELESDDDSKAADEEDPDSDGEHDADEVLHSFSR